MRVATLGVLMSLSFLPLARLLSLFGTITTSQPLILCCQLMTDGIKNYGQYKGLQEQGKPLSWEKAFIY